MEDDQSPRDTEAEAGPFILPRRGNIQLTELVKQSDDLFFLYPYPRIFNTDLDKERSFPGSHTPAGRGRSERDSSFEGEFDPIG